MFDIDRYLGDITLKDMQPGEDVITNTKKRCEEEQTKQHLRQEAMKKVKKGLMIAVPAAAVLLIGVFLGAMLFSNAANAPQAVAFYTVDINPSLRVQVDSGNVVTSVNGQNDDAEAIVKKLDCVGRPVTDAIQQIIAAVKDAGYFNNGQRYVLIGCFAADGTKVKGTLTDLQSKLESNFGGMIDLLIVSGSLEDMQTAEELKVSAGLLKLSQLADGVEVTGGEKVEEVATQVQTVNEPKYCAPDILSATPGKDGMTLKWDKLDFTKMGYAGKVKYGVAVGDTKEEVESMSATEVSPIEFYTYEDPELTATVKMEPGQTKYFAIYAHYGDIVKRGNVKSATMPIAEPTTSPKASVEPDPVKTDAPEPSKAPEPAETPLPAHAVSGRVSGEKVVLYWSAETAENFQGYKVVASRTNPNPKYPEDSYLKYITDPGKTSISLSAGSYGLKGGVTYYFSVTYLFSDGTTIAGNAVKLKVPAKDTEPEPTDKPSGDYASSNISGSIDGVNIHLSWDRINDSRFEGYKVVYSFTNASPKYPDDKYKFYITDSGDTGRSFNATELKGFTPGAACYFSITVLYEGGDVKVPGNVVTLTMPADVPAPPEYGSTTISGSIDADGTVHLKWDAITDSRLEGYKVMYSFSSSHPVYGESGDYADWITDGRTSFSVNIAELKGYTPGGTCYFSISALYEEHSVVKPGNAISFTAP